MIGNNQANARDYKTLITEMIHNIDPASDEKFLRQIYTILYRHQMKLSAQSEIPENGSIA